MQTMNVMENIPETTEPDPAPIILFYIFANTSTEMRM